MTAGMGNREKVGYKDGGNGATVIGAAAMRYARAFARILLVFVAIANVRRQLPSVLQPFSRLFVVINKRCIVAMTVRR